MIESGKKLSAFCIGEIRMDEKFYRAAFLNFLGVLLSGIHEDAVRILADTCRENGSGRYSVPGLQGTYSLCDAAEISCFASAIQAYDDIHFDSTEHPCGPVASAVIAVSQTKRISFKEALAALAAGMEAECRIGSMLFKEKSSGSAPGWYTTGIAGAIGAAAASGRLLGFSQEQMESVLGLAASFASGIRGTHGSMAGSYVPAIAASSGVRAALLVKNGFTCGLSALCGPNGLIRTIAPYADAEPYFSAFNEKFFSMDTSCKTYPYGFISFPLIDCLKTMRLPETVRSAEVTVSKRAAALGSRPDPSSMYDAFVSLPYIAASMILNKEAAYTPLHTDFRVSDAEAEMMKRVRIIADENLSDDAVMISVNDGEIKAKHTGSSGSASAKMTEEEVIHKFLSLDIAEEPKKIIHTILDEDIEDLAVYLNHLNQ